MVALDKQADLVNTQIDVLFYGLVILIAAMLLTCIFLDRSLWLQLVQLWVFLDVAWRLPKRIARFVTVRLLGDLSCIYNQVLCERFAIGEQCGGVAARLLSVSSTFADLADEQGVADRLEGGISRQRLGERLEAVLGKWGVGPQSWIVNTSPAAASTQFVAMLHAFVPISRHVKQGQIPRSRFQTSAPLVMVLFCWMGSLLV